MKQNKRVRLKGEKIQKVLNHYKIKMKIMSFLENILKYFLYHLLNNHFIQI